jgi:hypothetical protein
MAMLTATFNEIRGKAKLEWRLQFARRVLRSELVWMRVIGPTNAGTLDDNGKVSFAAARRRNTCAHALHPPKRRRRARVP